MTEIATIKYNLKEIYDHATECFYDIYIHDGCEDFEMGYTLFEVFKSSEVFIQSLKDGFSPCILPNFYVIEKLQADSKEFVVLVMGPTGSIWAAVNGKDINY